MINLIAILIIVPIAIIAPVITDLIIELINIKGECKMKNVDFVATLINYDPIYAFEYINKLNYNEIKELLDNELEITSKACKEIVDNFDTDQFFKLIDLSDNLCILFSRLHEKFKYLENKNLSKGVF